MKKILFLFSIMALFTMIFVPSANAQTANLNDKVIIQASDLTPAQLAKIEADKKLEQASAQIADLQKKIETYGKWVGVGGEIGTAVKEGLNAVVDIADKFGNTNVGKFTLTMIAWKVIGKDLVRIFLGLLLIGVTTIFIFINYRKNFTIRKVLIQGSRLLFWQPRKYEIIKPETYEGFEFVRYLYILTLLGSYGIAYAIMFA